MRKTVALLLLVAMVFTIPASFAEGTMPLQLLSQDTWFVAPEAYPQIDLAINCWYDYSTHSCIHVQFPCPANTFLSSFRYDSVHFCDTETGRQYTYQLLNSKIYNVSFESFIQTYEDNGALILQDGSDGTAIALSEDRTRANVMIRLGEPLPRNTSLTLSLYAPELKKVSVEQATNMLTEIIYAEINRINATMQYVQDPAWWSMDRFTSYTVTAGSEKHLSATLTLDKAIKLDGYAIEEPTLFPVSYSNSKLELYACYDEALTDGYNPATTQITLELDNISYPVTKLQQNHPNASVVTLSNGVEATMFISYSDWNEVHYILSLYLSIPAYKDARNNKEYYFNLTLKLPYKAPATVDQLLAYVNEMVVPNLTINSDTPLPSYRDYAPYAETAVDVQAEDPSIVEDTSDAAPEEPSAVEGTTDAAPEEPEQAQEGWACEGCGHQNADDFSFCSQCGTAKPVIADSTDAEWVCANCSNVNDGAFSFCPMCGTKKPAAGWVCPVCQTNHTDEIRFCPYDGTPKP